MPVESATACTVVTDAPRPPPAPASVSPPPAPRSGKATESASLATEARDLLNRIGGAGVGRRCAEYRPTVDELRATTFSDYVRGEVLGVPLPGYEFLYIYEDGEGREKKREAPPGQVPPPPPVEAGAGRGEGRASSSSSGKEDGPMRTRSQARAIEEARRGAGTRIVPPKAYVPRPKKYQMCWHKLRDGIAKVSLPSGFWAKMDTTGRGRHWAKGSKYGDMMIPSPIKQALSGIGGVYEYTLLEQPPVRVAEFRSQADAYRERHVGSSFDDDHSDEHCDSLARKFWRRLGPTAEPATYGADMEGTLFRDAPASGWNVDRLESCLCLLRADAGEGGGDDDVFRLPGVTSAYLYFGMWASAFAAHNEDMNLLSINYLHAGAPKYWYAIAQEDSARFECLARSHFPGPASECREFLRHKRCLLSPTILRKAGIKFTTAVQRPGDAIITFPGSYHFGFNTGFNIAESTNFAVPEWIPFGEAANVCMCHPHSVRIQMRRLKSLLESYEKDMCYRDSVGLSHLTYTNWAKHEAKRIKKEKRGSENKKVMLNDREQDPLRMPLTLNASAPVEVTKESVTIRTKSNKRKTFRREEVNEWRLAKRVRPHHFVPGAQVICIVPCDNARPSAKAEYESFLGTVVKVVDEHIKVHLIGCGKKDDIWFEQDSDCLFLDAGATDAPSAGSGSAARPRKRNGT